jgi:3,4-dihydroxy 2-butanone 4-phosphate synthase
MSEADLSVQSPCQSAPGSRIDAALRALRLGRPVLLLDDADRENEADLIVPAHGLRHEIMAMLIREGSGIVCLCLTPAHADRLGLVPMVERNRSRYGTAFTVSIEAAEDIGTGVSARDRVRTIAAAIAPGAGPGSIVSPGHVFPIVARPGGVIERRGHTEGAIDLMRLAGLPPAAVLCELMNPDGTMAHGAQVEAFALTHDLVCLTLDDLVEAVTRV